MEKQLILTLNGGSSSLKFAGYQISNLSVPLFRGKFERLGTEHTRFSFSNQDKPAETERVSLVDGRTAAEFLLGHLDEVGFLDQIAGVGHRLVHGGSQYYRPAIVDSALIKALGELSVFSPEHLPAEISIVELCRDRLPAVPQVACFDTAFHHGMPAVARRIPIPRRYAAKGIQRYGFHGLSCSYVLEELERQAGDAAAGGRLILAHLGNGASLTAVHKRQSIDTTMGFTPASGVPMSSRSGDIDPGLVLFLSQTEGMDARTFHRMANTESGLLGVSETSSDIKELLRIETGDIRAAEAVALFCYRIRQSIGALAASLGGLDTLIFTGGIGEHAAAIRERICADLGFLGIALHPGENARNAAVISRPEAETTVRVIATNEESVIVKTVVAMLNGMGTTGRNSPHG